MRRLTHVSAAVQKRPTKQRTPEQVARLMARAPRLRELRERAGFTSQAAVNAKLPGIQSVISKAERGLGDQQGLTLEDLADVYGVSVDCLLNRAPVPPVDDPYPARRAVLESPEYASAPEGLRQWFVSMRPDGAEAWSAVQWSRVLLGSLAILEATGQLPGVPGAPVHLLRPPRS